MREAMAKNVMHAGCGGGGPSGLEHVEIPTPNPNKDQGIATRTFVEFVALTWSRPQKEQAALQEKSPSPFGPKYDAVM
ncbi:unnamed protein product [Prunus armeniaca]|uniref:Uncharacterized protein n=1 Tax=Prunus armeniaca TaxID=36596 RepID=A0A6J5Y6J8_PRUAR|nr:unnamed protein product [Prunus armeniaca]